MTNKCVWGGGGFERINIYNWRAFCRIYWQALALVNQVLSLAIINLRFFFNSISKYDPVTKTTTSEITYIPMIVGIILFAIGTTISRYDELVKEFYRTYDERPDAWHAPKIKSNIVCKLPLVMAATLWARWLTGKDNPCSSYEYYMERIMQSW